MSQIHDNPGHIVISQLFWQNAQKCTAWYSPSQEKFSGLSTNNSRRWLYQCGDEGEEKEMAQTVTKLHKKKGGSGCTQKCIEYLQFTGDYYFYGKQKVKAALLQPLRTQMRLRCREEITQRIRLNQHRRPRKRSLCSEVSLVGCGWLLGLHSLQGLAIPCGQKAGYSRGYKSEEKYTWHPWFSLT